jgi:uncharacterized membrane protein YadS
MKKECLPGWGLMLVVGIAATFISKLVVVGGKNPIEAAVLAIIFGIIIRNAGILPKIFYLGLRPLKRF